MPTPRQAGGLSATHVGVHHHLNANPARVMSTCPRCGYQRSINTSRSKPGKLCTACKAVEPNWGQVSYR